MIKLQINKVMLMGRLTNEPTLESGSNMSWVNFSLALNYKGRDKQDKVEYIRITAYDKTAELLSKYCVKGQEIIVEGRLKSETFNDKEGKAKYGMIVIANVIQFGAKPKEHYSKDNGEQNTEKPNDNNIENSIGETDKNIKLSGVEYETDEK